MKKILTLMALLVAFVTTGFADTWTVAGSDATLFGETWNPALEANDMTETSTGVFTWTKENVTLDGSDIKFKVCKNHAWSEAYPGNDWVINSNVSGYSNGAGRYDVTITMDVNNEHYITVVMDYLGAVVLPDAEITSVEIRGATTKDWEESSQFNLTLEEGTDNVYTGTIDLRTSVNDAYFKLVVNDDNWIGYSANLIDQTGLAITSEAGDGSNLVLANSDGVYMTYTVTATWTPNPSATTGWTLKIEGKDERVAEISTAIFSWGVSGETPWEDITLTKAADSYTYTGTLDLSDVLTDKAFLLKINNELLGSQELALADATTAGLVTVSETEGADFILKNATSGYKKYGITATWTPGPDASAGWTLTIDPEEARPKTTFTATFVNGARWENVFAYIWKVDGDNNVELNGPFPGVQLEKTGTTDINSVEYDVYTFTFETYDETAVPEMIIFSDGTDTNKTEDLEFVNEKEYTETVPQDYYVIVDNDTKWVALGKMDYNADMEEYYYNLDETWTGKYFAIAPASALNADGSVAKWEKVLRPKSESGNYLVELRQYYDDVVTGGNNVWEKADEITRLSIHYYIDVQDFALYPESDVTISDAGYATYSNKYDYFTVDAKVSIVKNVEGNKAVLEELEFLDGANKGISGGTGVILEKDLDETDVVTIYPYEKYADNEYVDVTGNMLIGSGNSTYDITGNDTSVGDYTAYILAKPEGKDVGFYLLDMNGNDKTLAAHKAFLAVRKNQSAPDFIGFGDTTGINNVEREALNVEGCYTLDGRRVENPTKGLYIINGKKVLVK
jgi:hypothetical protein